MFGVVARLVLAGVAASCGVSCSEPAFQCAGDAACVRDGEAGFCEPDGYCSFVDEGCDSGRRYGEFGGNAYAGQCVPVAATDGAADGSTGPGGSETGAASVATTLADSTTIAADGDTTTVASTGGSSSEGDDAPATDSTTGPGGPEPNVAFVTSATIVPGQLGGLAAADAACAAAAAVGGLDGAFVAWLSDEGVNAIDRLEGSRGWVRTDGAVLADRPADLAQGLLWHPIDRDETTTQLQELAVATGTLGSGQGGAANTRCDNWTDDGPDAVMYVGRSSRVAPGWTQTSVTDCSNPVHLYCFEVGKDVPIVVEPPARSRLAFVSQTQFAGDAGLPAFDAACNQEAAAAGESGTFLAFVGSDEGAPIDRFDTDGPPWVNRQGVPIADTAATLLIDDDLNTPVRYNASGGLSEYVSAWTGARNPSDATAQTCGGWADVVQSGRRGTVADAERWMDAGTNNCTQSFPVFCFEQ